MWDDRDPDFAEIRAAFLEAVDEFHRRHGYSRDFRRLAAELGVTVKEGEVNKAFTTPEGERVILIDPREPRARLAFTGLHELAHHLFQMALDGELDGYLRSLFFKNRALATQAEENLCFEAAARLMMPGHLLEASLQAHGYGPLAVFHLARHSGASHQAALRRVVQEHETDVHAVLVAPNGKVLYSLAHGPRRGRNSVGSGFVLPRAHPLHPQGFPSEGTVTFEDRVPFKRSSAVWRSKVVAAREAASGRVLAFYLDRLPRASPDQPGLFP